MDSKEMAGKLAAPVALIEDVRRDLRAAGLVSLTVDLSRALDMIGSIAEKAGESAEKAGESADGEMLVALEAVYKWWTETPVIGDVDDGMPVEIFDGMCNAIAKAKRG